MTRSGQGWVLLSLGMLLAASACNDLSGASKIVITDAGDDSGSDAGEGAGGGTADYADYADDGAGGWDE